MWWRLWHAIRANEIKFVKEMLTNNPQLAMDKGTGMEQSSLLLHVAASENRTEICALLIAKMIPNDLCITDMRGCNAMHYAAENGNMQLCKLLFQKAPKSIYKSDGLGQTMLIRAAKNAHSEVCLFFIDLVDKDYIKLRECLAGRYTLLHYVAEKGLTKVGEVILNKYPELHNQIEHSFEKTLLHLSAENGHEQMSKMLIDKHPNLAMAKTTFGATPLALAAKEGHTAVCRMFIEHFPSLLNVITPFNLPNILRFSVESREDMEFFSIVREECVQVISSIILNNVEYILYLNSGSIKTWDVILQACPELVNKIRVIDNTLLHTAARNGQTEICKLLLEKYPYLINTKIFCWQTTALDLAVKNGHLETCELLLSYMSPEEINMPNCDNGETVLHMAIEKYKFKICELLISKMTPKAINHVNNSGKTALDILDNLYFSMREENYNKAISLNICLKSYISDQPTDLLQSNMVESDSKIIGDSSSDVL